MEDQKQAIPTAGGDSATVWMAIELSSKEWVIALQSSADERVRIFKRRAGDVGAVVELARKAGARLSLEGRGARAITCYEAGRDGFWLHRELSRYGIVNYVIDPGSLHVDRRARRAKTDRIDVQGLLRTLQTYVGGQRAVCSMVRVPSVAEEDARHRHREYHRLVKERTGHINRIRGLCALHGIVGYAPARSDRRARLERLRTANGEPLPPNARQEILRELARLELVMAQIAELETEMAAVLRQASATTELAADQIRALAKLRGIGIHIATVLAREVFYRHFDDRRKVASYVGLTPSPWRSGRIAYEQGISKAGNPLARTLLVELAWLWPRYQPDSMLSRWFLARVHGAGGRVKRILVVALARKLAVALWLYLTTGLVPTGATLKKA